jgi:hypothetical protein
MKPLLYPIYLAAVAGVLIFNAAARRRGARPGVLAAGNAAWLVGMALFMAAASEPTHAFHDFRVAYWRAGRLALTDPAGMYSAGELFFVNLPAVALLFVPLARLEVGPASWAFTAAGVAAVAAAWVLLVRLAGLTGWRRWALAGLFVCNGPLFYSLRHGNVSHFVLLLLAGALWSLEHGREVRLGMWLAAAAVLKPPLLLLPAFFGLRRWRVAVGGAAVLVPVVGASLALFGADVHQVWYTSTIQPFAGRPLTAFNVQSLGSAIARLLSDEGLGRGWVPVTVGAPYALLHGAALAAVAGGTLLACGRRLAGRSTPIDRLEFCLLLCAGVVTSPVSWTHYYLWLLIPAALALGGRLGVPPGRAFPIALGVAFVAMTPLVRGWSSGGRWAALLVSHYLAGGLVLWGVLAVSLWQQGRRGESLLTAAARLPHRAPSSAA